MTTNQKIEFSREVRQWIGIAVAVIGTSYMVAPDWTKDKFEKSKNWTKEQVEKFKNV